MKQLDVITAVLVVVGALNWGMVGVADFNLVAALFGDGSVLSRSVYSLVGLAGLFQAVQFKAIQKRWCHTPAFA